MSILIYSYLFSWFCFSSCTKPIVDNTALINTGATTDTVVAITTDKASYKPGDDIVFTIDKSLPATTKIRYRQLGDSIGSTTINGTTWHWTAPAKDFTGYMVEVYSVAGGQEKVYGSIAVDVSSDWSSFPRYGFLSSFGQLTNDAMASVMSNLNRYHVNGLQFYDWAYEHHQPLAGTVASPANSWKDIASRDTYKATVQQYISLAHGYNMKAMDYNLCYGALNDAATAGVQDQWYMYTDANHTTKAVLNLSSPFKSNIYLLDPGNAAWQNYIAAKTADVYSVYNFDGYHVDQLGDWGKMYNYAGNQINVETGFGSFLSVMKAAAPTKKLVMNAVNQYGQQASISQAPVDFLYTEVWKPNESYSDLATIIQNNNAWSNNTKKTVLAAYMDYNLADNAGNFNTPGVLLTDAVIFAFGGSHLELGEHMLGKEYFPNSNLLMKPDLQKALVKYYDFLVAYENILRDGGTFNSPVVTSSDGKISLNNWPPKTGQVSVIGKDMGNRQIIHLINLANASSFDWRDANGSQTTPNTYQNLALSFSSAKTIKKLWYASPDVDGGVAKQLLFTQSGNTVSFALSTLQYWDMVVAEY